MTRLINADALEERKVPFYVPDVIIGKNIDTYNAYQLGWNDAIDAIVENEPTVEAEPIKHAHWIWKGEEGYSRFMCSECGRVARVPTIMGKPDIWEYCPNCGAKMDGKRPEE